ncbi:hypothetical protein AB0R12_20630 [Streptomyces niveus]|uniref:hypothetical protein n=1 Tax=Streptomyces niveus TaxID=193462 RepID=UPI003435D784
MLTTRPLSLAGPPALLLVTGAAAGVAAVAAPTAARGWLVVSLAGVTCRGFASAVTTSSARTWSAA